jgi:general secretion pathway protein D
MVSVEVRFITITDDCLQRAGFDTDSNQPQFLDNKGLFHLMETAQADVQTNVMQAPRMTTGSGQMCTIKAGDSQTFVTGVDFLADDTNKGVIFQPRSTTIETGTNVSVKPVVSADKRYVRMDINAELSDLAKPVNMVPITIPFWAAGEPIDSKHCTPFTQQIQLPVKNVQLMVSNTVTVPDGGTVLLAGKKTVREVREEPPVPKYMARFFKPTVRRVTENTLVLVTPRIISQEETEVGVACPKSVVPTCLPVAAQTVAQFAGTQVAIPAVLSLVEYTIPVVKDAASKLLTPNDN